MLTDVSSEPLNRRLFWTSESIYDLELLSIGDVNACVNKMKIKQVKTFGDLNHVNGRIVTFYGDR